MTGQIVIICMVLMKLIKSGSRPHKIIEDELRILARVTATLSEISTTTVGAPDFDAEMISLRDQIAESKPEDIPALVEQMMRINAIAQRYGKGKDLPVAPESPYFAHLRLEEEQQTRDVLIGKHGYINRQRNVQIVDWRNAPVSRIYYRYEEGDDYEEQFGGRDLEGWVLARRSLTIEEARLKRIGCPQGTFIAGDNGDWFKARPVTPSQLGGGQGAATRAPAMDRGGKGSRLGVMSGSILRADKHLPEIAALIDRTQFSLITRPESGLVVLQGGAGSGKTTVALHRVAYLNYAMPGRFHGGRIMVVVLTDAMVRYVERVLPSLGVKGVPVLTARTWMSRLRRRVVPQAPKSYSDDTPSEVARLKKHPLMLTLLQEYVEGQMGEMSSWLRRELRGAPEQERVLARWEELAHRPPVARSVELRRWIEKAEGLSRLTVQRGVAALGWISRRLRDVLTDWGEIFTDRAYLSRAVERLSPGSFGRRDLDLACDWCARQLDPGPAPRSARDLPLLVGPKKRDEQKSYISLDGVDERDDLPGTLDMADDALLLYLTILKRGALLQRSGKPLRYEHLVVDEAQDLSMLELKVLLHCTSKLRSITLAGDTAQRTVFDNAFSDWESLLERIHAPEATTRTLRLGYRSTEPIMALARGIIGDKALQAEVQATRTGTSVELHQISHSGEAVAILAEALRSLVLREPQASVALIARHLTTARAYARDLTRAEVPGVRLVADQEFTFSAGIEVTDVTQVKGLEFDYVILLDVTAANYPDNLESRHLLHIAATRAAHQLWLISVGEVSPLLRGMLK